MKKNRIMGVAFLIQSITPLIASAVLLNPLISGNDIIQIMTRVAGNPVQMRAAVLGEMITALGIIFLGVVLYQFLRKENEIMALTGLGFYMMEAVLLVISRSTGFTLLGISLESAVAGHPVYLQSIADMLLNTMDFNYTLAMLAFSTGAPLFYYLLYRSRMVPSALALWGFVTAIIPCLAATLLSMMGIYVPFFVYLPYAPFEFVIGIWILVKGIRGQAIIAK
ncbi:MAG: DUF4386 domain-containing protein [Leptolinea sp.]|nr:DUF4386 domain-containing protein [Leptolinea sp.]